MSETEEPKTDEFLQGLQKSLGTNKTENEDYKTVEFNNITYIPPVFLIDQILIESSVGFISASPGSKKTWLVWDMALSVATGTKCLNQFTSKKGRVLAFNAEDSQSMTKDRVTGLANHRDLEIPDNFRLIDEAVIDISNISQQKRLENTVKSFKPDLLILDPFRQIHHLNEDKASDMAPLLAYLRYLNRTYNTTIMLVVHERKSSEGGRREDKTRGSNVVEGWRDTAIYMDTTKENTKVQVYHRGHKAPEPFFFSLEVDGNPDPLKSNICLQYTSEDEIKTKKLSQINLLVLNEIINQGPLNATEITDLIGKRRSEVFASIKYLESKGAIEKQKGKNKKYLKSDIASVLLNELKQSNEYVPF